VTDIRRERWTATPRRQLLREQIVLRTKGNRRLGSFYWEAIRSLREGEDEVRFQVAGHLLRELQEELPKHLDVPEPKAGGVGEFWGWIQSAWEAVSKDRPATVGNQLWKDATIDGPLARFLAKLHDKIRHYKTVMDRKANRFDHMLVRLDPSLSGAPGSLREDLVRDWMHTNGVFNAATHSVDPDEFEDTVEIFERLLEDRVARQTLEKEDAITAFIREVEGRA
jgi:hypothetical protein